MSDTPVPAPTRDYMAWAKMVVSVVVLAILVPIALAIAYIKNDGSLGQMLGAITGMGTTVIGYWLGSSSGSDRKTEMLTKSGG